MDKSRLDTFYETEAMEDMRLSEESLQYIEFITAMKYIQKYLPQKSKILDTCAGTGVYASALSDLGHEVTVCDIVRYNVEVLERSKEKYKGVYCLDTRDLSCFSEESFDMVLCMGALYHLSSEEDRKKVIKESKRVLKKGGTLITTHINRYAVILNNLHTSIDNMSEIESFLADGKEDIFYCTTPEEAQEELREEGLSVEKTIALDGVTIFMFDTHKILELEKYKDFVKYHLNTCEVPSLIGYSYHFMAVNKK